MTKETSQLSFSAEERPWDLGKERLGVSATFGDEFAKLLEQLQPIFSSLPSEVLTARLALTSPKRPENPIVLDTPEQAACLLRTIEPPVTIIGAKVGKESIITHKKSETANQIVFLMMNALGCPPTDKVDIGFLGDRLAGREKDTIILIIAFGSLPPSEQKKLQGFLRKNRILRKVPQIYVQGGAESTTGT